MKKIFKIIGISLLGMIPITILSISIHNQAVKIDHFKNDRDSLLNLYSIESNKTDSLVHVNYQLSKYRTLTDAMVYRDSIRKPLPIVGSFLYLKIDSSKVVLEDIVIGGGKYEYYIRYKIRKKNNASDFLSPEMVY